MKSQIKQLHEDLINKKISCQQLISNYLKTIKEKDGEIHAFLEVYEDESLAQAKKVDEKIAAGEKIGLLEGLPIAVKDNLLYKNHHASSGSKILENYVCPYNATVIQKIIDAGMIIIGRTNMDEFAMGSSTESSAYGPTKNPHDLTRVPGGTSGGSAAAVAANMAPVALGSDTGGSVRQPAAFCGIVGLKPTYGAVSRYGLMANTSSFDQIGPFANSAEDAKIIFELIKGRDINDATSTDTKDEKEMPKKMRIGLPKEYFMEGLDPAIKKMINKVAAEYIKNGAEIVEISLPHTAYALAAYYLIMPSEASSNLARYDGIRYGMSDQEKSKNLIEVYTKSRAAGFGSEVKRRIILGTYCLSSGYYDAYYKKARHVQELIRRDFMQAFETVNVILTPTTPTVAFKLNEKSNDPLTMYLSDIYTVSINMAGVPAVSVPYGTVDNMPVGVQIISKPFTDSLLLDVAAQLEVNS